ncbi:hypothetical protein K2173_003583 [Erythroxylum novogranatense]|uniref:C2H2-type domain-containing protein n=1 Tax=Erythroxylum novogranatense TaxID=1862640 RepID=A0AAV8TBS5_9ROSI|nr:hypothetical protein K2173_003583 [Erythroxylum novogranatense]
MSGSLELGFQRTSACSLKEQSARTTLNNVRLQGHPYVELRQDGKRFIFFCTLCLAPCYSDSVLLDHLKGNLHRERLSAAKLTLLKPNPWPFSDGIHFFDITSGEKKDYVIANDNQHKLLESHGVNNSHAIVSFAGHQRPACVDRNEVTDDIRGAYDLVIPTVLFKDEIIDLKAKFIGSAKITARFSGNDGIFNEVIRIWCEWLGKDNSGNEEKDNVLDHDFAVVTFSYNCDLGRGGLLEDMKLLLSNGPSIDLENDERTRKKRRKSFSDPEDISGSLFNQCDLSRNESSASVSVSSKLLLDQCEDHLLLTSSMSNKAIKKELRRQQRLAEERPCDICQQKMLPGKDVATLVNLKTEKLACSSRNLNGVFHVFHTSCLVHWILLCEFEMVKTQCLSPKSQGRSRRKNGAKSNKLAKDEKTKTLNRIDSVFCSDCQGTGVNINEDEKEMPNCLLSQLFKLKIKVGDGHRAWMKYPELLENCSTGLSFACHSDKGTEVSHQIHVQLFSTDKLSLFIEIPPNFTFAGEGFATKNVAFLQSRCVELLSSSKSTGPSKSQVDFNMDSRM